MKKLLVLMLVLGMSSVASATLIGMSIDGSDTPIVGSADIVQGVAVVLSVIGDNASGFEYVDLIKGDATFALPVATAAAGNLATVADFSTTTLYDYELQTSDSLGNYPGGICFTSALTATSALGATFHIDILDGSTYEVMEMVTFTIVPEPMTVALLGLGGLFLRRRR